MTYREDLPLRSLTNEMNSVWPAPGRLPPMGRQPDRRSGQVPGVRFGS
jgi:hypothetical protein